MSLERLKDNFLKILRFLNEENFCMSALDVADHVDSCILDVYKIS